MPRRSQHTHAHAGAYDGIRGDAISRKSQVSAPCHYDDDILDMSSGIIITLRRLPYLLAFTPGKNTSLIFLIILDRDRSSKLSRIHGKIGWFAASLGSGRFDMGFIDRQIDGCFIEQVGAVADTSSSNVDATIITTPVERAPIILRKSVAKWARRLDQSVLGKNRFRHIGKQCTAHRQPQSIYRSVAGADSLYAQRRTLLMPLLFLLLATVLVNF